MKSIDILPITIFESYIEVPDSLIEGIKNDSKDDTKYDTPPNWDGGAYSSFNYVSDLLYRTEQNKQLIDNFVEIIKSRPEYSSFGDDFIYEYQLWWNYYTNWQYQEYHSHGNNLISGIWYLTDSSAHTVFCERGIKHKVAAEKGKLIFFPSSLAHYVEPSNDERMTVSFNFQLFQNRPKLL